MMWVLSVIHSEIVATNPDPEKKLSQIKKSRCYRERRCGTFKRVVSKKKVKVVEVKETEQPQNVVATNSTDSESQR